MPRKCNGSREAASMFPAGTQRELEPEQKAECSA